MASFLSTPGPLIRRILKKPASSTLARPLRPSYLSSFGRPLSFGPFFSFLPHGRRRREKERKRNGVEKCYTEDLSSVTATRRKNSFARLPRALVISVKRGGGIIESLLARRKYADHESVIEDERTCPLFPLNPRSNRRDRR